MRRLKLNGLRLACITGLVSLLLLSINCYAANGPLDNVACLNCHDNQKHKIELPESDGEKRALGTVDRSAYVKSVHGGMQCLDCHKEITDSRAKHVKAKDVQPANCINCHESLWETAKKEKHTDEKPRLGLVVKNIEAYKNSFHARPDSDDPSHAKATCEDCHSSHSFNIPPRDSSLRSEWLKSIPATCGDKCHEDQLDAYKTSIHGKEVLRNNNFNAAVCTDCHSAHGITNTSSDSFKLAISADCGSCHEANFKTYKATYHGQVSTLGYANTAKCYNCHGSHAILKADDPKSRVHEKNRMKTCRECHSGKQDIALAPAGFATFQPHADVHDFTHYPAVWIAYQMMVGLLLGTFGFFWLHTALWFYREFIERKNTLATQRMVETETVNPALVGKHVQRFTATWRVAHLIFALSLMILTLTGMPLFYPDAPWASAIMKALGGPQTAGIIHRVNAVIFTGVFFWHLIYVALRLTREWKTFKIFGPTSLIPNWQDGKDMLAMFKWFLGMGPRPIFDRWTYWEKFDYWAPFWGVTIIGTSGLIMWLPNITAQYLPGWVFNVAAIFHGEEAFLAVVFLFTVHFFNNHFRPDKFPLEIVMFTGTMTLEDFKHDHALEYQRLVDAGELEKVLVDAPSPTRVGYSKILGFILIAIGLTLLTLVAIGFFNGG